MVKHESGFYIPNVAALKEWQVAHRDATGQHEQFFALVPMRKCKYIKSVAHGAELFDPSNGKDVLWVVREICRDSDSPIYFEKYPVGFRYELGNTYYSGCWFSTEIFPLDLLRSPARLALESLGARLA